jgi:hypothetical protein
MGEQAADATGQQLDEQDADVPAPIPQYCHLAWPSLGLSDF